MPKKVELNNEDFAVFDGSILCCPKCGEENLHQTYVEVWSREEDADSGVHGCISGENFTADTDMVRCPSPRRSGLTVGFFCEHCHGGPSNNVYMLQIIQHKGNTFLRWTGI